MKRISVLGSTGFIGTSTLDVIAAYPERFQELDVTLLDLVLCLLKQMY